MEGFEHALAIMPDRNWVAPPLWMKRIAWGQRVRHAKKKHKKSEKEGNRGGDDINPIHHSESKTQNNLLSVEQIQFHKMKL